jgi:diaminopimelate epimerase
MTRSIPFVKATACGNDFILIEGALVAENERKAVTRRICDRHLGVGADGVEWLFPTNEADIYAHLINSDGSDAEVSGNGTRCVAAWHVQQHQTKSPDDLDKLLEQIRNTDHEQSVRVLTDAGVKTCTLVRRLDNDYEFRSDMGEPKIAGEVSIAMTHGEQRGIRLSTGNPQFVTFVEQFPPNWLETAAEIEGHRDFPHRTNVEFVKAIGQNEIEIRIFERGAGETQSSGTGSCASAVAAIYSGRAKSPVKVVSTGGPQTVEWNGDASAGIFLTGPAQILCAGEFYF